MRPDVLDVHLWVWSTHGRQFDLRERRDTCFAAALFSHGTSRCFVPAASPSNTCCLGTFRAPGMSSRGRAPRDQGCCSVLPTVGRALRFSTHESLHGFADGSCGCQGASSPSTLFVRLWLHDSFSPAKRFRMLLPIFLPTSS